MIRALVIALLAGGCAFGDGDYFATVSARIDARATNAGSWQELPSGFEVQLAELTLTADELELVGPGEGAAQPEDDHGHEHGDEEEPPAEDAGELIALHLEVGELDLAAGVDRPLPCEPASCGIADWMVVTTARMHVDEVIVRGTVRDSQLPPRIAGPVAFQLELDHDALEPLGEIELDGELELAADRDHDPEVALTVVLRASASILDHVAWDELTPSAGGYDLAADPGTAAEIAGELAAIELELAVER